jgi:hypothetical protein
VRGRSNIFSVGRGSRRMHVKQLLGRGQFDRCFKHPLILSCSCTSALSFWVDSQFPCGRTAMVHGPDIDMLVGMEVGKVNGV